MFRNSYPKLSLLLSGLVILLGTLLAACGETPTATPAAPTTTAAAIITTVANTQPTGEARTVALSPRASTGAATTTAGFVTQPQATPSVAAPTSNPGQATAGQIQLTTSPALIKKAGGQTINLTVELARTSQEQQTGLMGRTSLAEGTGMLFVFPAATTGGFWMRNTLIPLSIAFIDQQGVILNIQDMQPQSDEVHAPGQPYLTALEVPQGYFTKQGIKAGDIFLLVR